MNRPHPYPHGGPEAQIPPPDGQAPPPMYGGPPPGAGEVERPPVDETSSQSGGDASNEENKQ